MKYFPFIVNMSIDSVIVLALFTKPYRGENVSQPISWNFGSYNLSSPSSVKIPEQDLHVDIFTGAGYHII